jgi:amino-acid N-acetyltransferase
MVKIQSAAASDIPGIENLLLASQLLTEGLRGHISNFFVAKDEGTLVGVAGFENCGEGVGLLRSFAVLPERRNQGIARKLYEQIATQASHSGVSALYLLTTTAQGYFSKLGFSAVERSRAPEAIRNTNQFRELCPDSAVLMFRALSAGGGGRLSVPQSGCLG